MDIDPDNPADSSMRPNIQKYSSALQSFTSSRSAFQIVHSVSSAPNLPPPKTLYILDSSFNPPTLAHLRIARDALLHDSQASQPDSKALLLLLATSNADKPAVPASFPQRLCMMQLLCSSLLPSLPELRIDIGLTTQPYFVAKAAAIASSGAYAPETPQVHLTGFDTLVRILDAKYYPQEGLRALQPFFERGRLRVAYRADGAWGDREEQDAYLKGLESGEGREWVDEGKIEMCEGRRDGEEVVSSTRVRGAVKAGDRELLGKLVPEEVAEWVLQEKLYTEE